MSDGHDDAYQDGYRAGLVVATEEIVEWLRSDIGKGSEEGTDWADTFADAIERGEHNKTSAKP